MSEAVRHINMGCMSLLNDKRIRIIANRITACFRFLLGPCDLLLEGMILLELSTNI